MRIVVIGAGLAGLAAADALRREGADVVVVEARDRVGGRVWSTPFAGGVAERGAEFVFPGDEVLQATARRLGLRLYRKGTHYGDREPRGGPAVTPAQLGRAVERLGEAALDGTVLDALASLGLSCGRVRGDRRARRGLERLPGVRPRRLGARRDGRGVRAVRHLRSRGRQRPARRGARRPARPGAPPRRRRSRRSSGAGARWPSAPRDVELWAHRAVVAVPAPAALGIAFDPPLPEAKARGARRRPLRPGGEAPPSAARPCGAERRARRARPLLDATRSSAPTGARRRSRPPSRGRRGRSSGCASGPARGPGRRRSPRCGRSCDLDLAAPLLSTWHDDPWAHGAYSARSRSSPLDTAELARPVGPLAFAGEHTAGDWHGLMEGALRSGLRAPSAVLG